MVARPTLRREDRRGELTPAERTLVVASAIVAVALFAYLGYQAVTTPDEAMPTVEVRADGAESYVVIFRNEGGTGIAQAAIHVRCGEEEHEVTFENVPASSTRRAVVPCEDGAPVARLAWWKGA